MKAILLVALLLAVSPSQVRAEDDLTVGSQDLAIMDVDAVIEDARTEELRFNKKTTSADLRNIEQETAKTEAKLKNAKIQNQKLEEELVKLHSELTKKQSALSKHQALLAKAAKQNAALESKKAKLLKQIKATEIKKRSEPKKAIAKKPALKGEKPAPTHAENSIDRQRL